MELRNISSPICHVSYYPGKPYRIEECLDPTSIVQYLLNGIRCDKLFTAVTAVRANPDEYKKDFDAVVAFLTHYRLLSLVRSDLPRGRRQVLPMALLKRRLSQRNTPEKSITQCQWHCANSYTSFGKSQTY